MPDIIYTNRFPTLEEYDLEMAEHGLDFEPSFVASMRSALGVVIAVKGLIAQGQAPVSPKEPVPLRPYYSLPANGRVDLGDGIAQDDERSPWPVHRVVIKGYVLNPTPMFVRHMCNQAHVLHYPCRVDVFENEDETGPGHRYQGRVSHFSENVLHIE